MLLHLVPPTSSRTATPVRSLTPLHLPVVADMSGSYTGCGIIMTTSKTLLVHLQRGESVANGHASIFGGGVLTGSLPVLARAI